MKINTTQLAACLFVLVCTGLLIGLRFDAVIAGGDGITTLPASLYLIEGQAEVQHFDELRTLTEDAYDDFIVRGETVKTKEGAMAGMNLGYDVEIILDENTDLEIDQLSTEAIEITLHRGRIILESDHKEVELNGKYTKWILQNGALTAVNYDFLEVMSVANAEDPETNTDSYLVWGTEQIPLTEPISVTETPPGSWEYTEFDYNLDFYNYVPPALQGMGY